MADYGKIKDSCSCGQDVFILTDKGAYRTNSLDETTKVKSGRLVSSRMLVECEYPLPY